MGMRVRLMLGRLFDAGEAETAFGRALLQERYRALQQQIPLLYLIALVNFIGLTIASGAPITGIAHPANILILCVIARLIHWLRSHDRVYPPERILVELRITLVLAGILSLAFGCLAILLYSGTSDPHQQSHVIPFALLASLGCAYGLSSFPAAARLPLLLFALPLAVTLAGSSDSDHFGVGVSLALIVLLVLRLLNLQNKSFVELVRSRSEIEIERERASRAEQVALAEKARVRRVADTDPLTDLANRRAMLAVLEGMLARPAAPLFTLALLDLDGFKPINDTFGHATGDSVLIEVSARLLREAGSGAVVARMGGDEFALMLPCGDEEGAARAGKRICAAIGRPYRIEGREFRISACCGLAVIDPGQCTVTLALSRGDAALYSGKQQGRGSVALFTPALERANQRRVEIERALMEPAVHEKIDLAFQPIFDLSTGAIRAFEALARWTHPQLGAIGPGEFIPITEQINVIEQISDSLLARAAAEAATWPDSVRLSFNLSAVELCSASSARRILRIIAGEGLDPARLQVEVTETAMLADFDTARLNLQRLRAAGVRIVLDDFGAGFASISYLREIFFDTIKLDGSLVKGAPSSPPALRLLKGVLDLCASIHVPCVAEHIEEPEQLELLRRLDCRDGQGFALSPPLDAAAARALTAAKLVPFLAKPKKARRAA